MTPLTLDSTPAVGNVRRPTALDNTRANNPSGAAAPTEAPARPSVVVNLNTSANQAALNNLTYTNPRAGAAARSAEAQAQAQAQATDAPRTTEREDTERLNTDRQNLQAAQATNTQRQAVAADQTA